jgi:NAD(P)-dependent dehydrogenase (short-subunit alcohol dehydrogenase family)
MGDKVCLVARGSEVEETASALGEHAIGIAADITKPADLARVADTLGDRWGGIDVLINNAGLHRGAKIDALHDDDWDTTLATNLTGPMRAIRAMLPLMADGGSIVNVGAVVGFRGFPGDSAYGASKAGLAGLTQVLAAELARRQIRVNLVIPGLVPTEMTAAVSERAKAKLIERIPLRREGTAEEIAEVVWWVAGSTYMTGSLVATDGGLMCAL